MAEQDTPEDWYARQLIQRGGLVLVICVVAAFAGHWLTKNVPDRNAGTTAVQILGILLYGLGVGLGIGMSFWVCAAALQRLCARTGGAGVVIVALMLIAMFLLFLLGPFCASPKSGDCRSIAERVMSATRARFARATHP